MRRGGQVSARRLLFGYCVWTFALLVLYYVFPGQKLIFWSGIGFSAAAAVLVGTVRNKPRRRTPWVLVSLALALFTAGDTTYLVLTTIMHEPNPFPSIADVFYLAMYPLLIVAMLLLPRSTTGRDRAGILDVLVVTAGFGLISWIFLISPNLQQESATTLAKLTSIAYPISDVLFLAVGARLLSAVRISPAVTLMAAGGVSLLITDVFYGLAQLQGTWSLGGPIDFGWIVFYGTWGAAALHPSMRDLTEPRVARESAVTTTRMVILTLSALIAPAILVIEEVRGTVHDSLAIATLSAVIFLLVPLRLAGVVRTNRQSTERERGLREAGAVLVSATDVDAVRATVRTAVARLLPVGKRHAVSFFLGTDRVHSGPRADGGQRFVRVADLPPDQAADFAGYEIALVNPLMVADRVAGHPLIGSLVVAADDTDLAALQGSLAVLAWQAALAIERITLSSEISRRRSEEYFRTLVRNTADVILIVDDDDDRIRYASPSARDMFGAKTAVLGRRVTDLVEPANRELAQQLIDLVRVRPEKRSARADWAVLGARGGRTEVEVSCRDLRHDPTVGGLVVTLRDVTEQRELERELKHRAFHDLLTGLPNRVLFTEQVERAVNRAHANATISGVIFIDLDDFKVINDTLGHDIGDQLVVAVGERLTAGLRPETTAARLGGDEFAVLVEDADNLTQIEELAEQTVQNLAEPILLGGNPLSASASVGVATTVDAANSSDLLRQADLAVYEAKGAGKGRWLRYQAELHTAVVERLAMRAALERALRAGDFVLQYQPIVRLVDQVTVGFEALVRWVHPTRGMVPPGAFIEVAEDTGLIVPIGEWVLQRALADAISWSRLPHLAEVPYLSVNVSAKQFRQPGFIEHVRDQLDRAGLPPQRLMLEITESLLLRDDEQVWTNLITLRDRGIRVAIDDFGTGYSSLSYLRQVPIDVLKIDKSFIDPMVASNQQRDLVEGIVRLAHTLGLEVVAEGIQRRRERDLLVDIGCRYGQGYLFSAPMADDDALRWLHHDHVPA
jgi:diguanylate cyclase (GGDEF)-like protein/PAS domain S-box-containing protein